MTLHEPRLRAAAASNRSRFHRLLPLSSLALALVACGRVPGQFEIVNNQVPTGSCSIPTDEGVYQGQGKLDVSLVQSGAQSAYFVFPLMKNNLPAAGGGIDSNKITLTSFAVDISLLNRDQAPQVITSLVDMIDQDPNLSAMLHYQTPWSGSVASGGGAISAYVAAFPVELAARLLGSKGLTEQPVTWVNLQIRAFGHTTTADIESDPFNYPVVICAGCLIANTQPCPFMSAPTNLGNPCNVAQDYFVDCCTAGNELICPPVVSQ